LYYVFKVLIGKENDLGLPIVNKWNNNSLILHKKQICFYPFCLFSLIKSNQIIIKLHNNNFKKIKMIYAIKIVCINIVEISSKDILAII